MFSEYSRVVLTTDRFQADGVTVGMTGYIIEVHDENHYEVEFSDQNGVTIAQVVVNEADIASAPES